MRSGCVGGFFAPVIIFINANAQEREAQRIIQRIVLGAGQSAAPGAGTAESVNGLAVCGYIDGASAAESIHRGYETEAGNNSANRANGGFYLFHF